MCNGLWAKEAPYDVCIELRVELAGLSVSPTNPNPGLGRDIGQ